MPEDKSRDYAVVIGIKAYSGLAPLSSAVQDAMRFIEWLRREDGGGISGDGKLIPILGDTFSNDLLNAEPNVNTIRNIFYKLGINRGERIGRRLYIYFSGHGFTSEVDEIGLAMANASRDYIDNSISFSAFRNLFLQVGYFDQVIFILDCCREQAKYDFSPQSVAHIKLMKEKFEKNNGLIPANGEAAPRPQIVRDLSVLATAFGEQSFAPPDIESGERRGLLTKALLEGLDGKAILHDGSITVASLKQYVSDRVKILAKDHNVIQEAQIRDENSEGIVFRDAFAVPMIYVRIEIDQSIKGKIILYDRDKSYEFDTANDNSVWDIILEHRSNPPYFLESTDPVIYEKLDLNNAKTGEQYVFSFPQSKK